MDLIVYESLQVEIICEVLLYLHSKLYRPINYSHCNYERENKKLLGRNLDSKKEIKIDQLALVIGIVELITIEDQKKTKQFFFVKRVRYISQQISILSIYKKRRWKQTNHRMWWFRVRCLTFQFILINCHMNAIDVKRL